MYIFLGLVLLVLLLLFVLFLVLFLVRRVQVSVRARVRNSRENNGNIKYYAICLKSDEKRVENVRRMSLVLPNLTIIDAVTTRDLDAPKVRKLFSTGFVRDTIDAFVRDREISVGQLACFLSHRKAFERISKDLGPFDKAVIIEDDVILHSSFVETIEKTTMALDDEPIDMINFYIHPGTHHPPLDHLNRRNLTPTPRGFWGTQCYAFKRGGLVILEGGTSGMLGAIDEQITRIPCIRSMTYEGPPIVHEDREGTPSTIANSTSLAQMLE